MEASSEAKEAAARALAEAYTAFMEAMQTCMENGVDIMAELEKQGIELPPFASALFGGVPDTASAGYDYPAQTA